MAQFMKFFHSSPKPNQTPQIKKLAYHPQYKQYKIIHQKLVIPNLPPPLHYFNFLSFIGQANIPILLNRSAIINNNLQNTATTISAISPNTHKHFNRYNIEHECHFMKDNYCFGQREILSGEFPHFILVRQDQEMSAEITINTTHLISYFNKSTLPLYDHWSLLCECTGEIQYQNQTYHIQQLGSFEYARVVNIPYLPLSFFTYQMINLDSHQQILLIQIRNNFNQIMQSKIYIRNLATQKTMSFVQNVRFIIHRIYPAVKTPNCHTMYLPREFEWQYKDAENTIHIVAQSRGDYKFGLAAGYVGSFDYYVEFNEQKYFGDAGYCEYIDCRPLKWQEKNKNEKLLDESANFVPILLKK